MEASTTSYPLQFDRVCLNDRASRMYRYPEEALKYESDKGGWFVTPGQWLNVWSQTGFTDCVASSSVASILSHSWSQLGPDFLPLYPLRSTIMQWPSNWSGCSTHGFSRYMFTVSVLFDLYPIDYKVLPTLNPLNIWLQSSSHVNIKDCMRKFQWIRVHIQKTREYFICLWLFFWNSKSIT